MSTANAGNHDNKGYAERNERRVVVKEETETRSRRPSQRSEAIMMPLPQECVCFIRPDDNGIKQKNPQRQKAKKKICLATPRTNANAVQSMVFSIPDQTPRGSK